MRYHDDWLKILGNIRKNKLGYRSFFKILFTSISWCVPSNQVSKIIMSQIDDGTITPVELIDKLYDNSSSYEMFVTEESFAGHELLVKIFKPSKRFGIKFVYPVLLLGYDKFDSLNKFDEFEKLVEIMLK